MCKFRRSDQNIGVAICESLRIVYCAAQSWQCAMRLFVSRSRLIFIIAVMFVVVRTFRQVGLAPRNHPHTQAFTWHTFSTGRLVT